MPILARDLMQPNVLTIPAGTPLAEIRHLFVLTGVYGAPVLDGDTVVGVISAIDLLEAADQACDDDRDPGEPAEQGLPSTLTAGAIASPDPIWVSPETPVAHVAQLMQRERIHRVLVGDGGRLDGILTTFDLLQAVQS